MKKIIFIIILFSLTIIGCEKDNPVIEKKIHQVTYKVTGASNDVLVTISGSTNITQYHHVALPFDLQPFQLEKGDYAGFNVLDWNNLSSAMIAQIIVDDVVVQDTTGPSFLQLGLILE